MVMMAFKQRAGWREILRSRASAYLLLSICSLAATYPLFQTGLPRGDLILEFTRVAEYTHLLQAGIFPVRWGADLEGGYGYPIYNFFPPLFMLISGIFAIAAGLSFTSAIKLTIFLLTLAGGISMFWFAREHFGKNGGLLSACLYVLAPYHFIDLFNRNAFSEFTALATAPLVFYGLSRVASENKFSLSTTILLTVGTSLFVLSHNLSVAMYAPLFFVYFMTVIAATGHWKRMGRIALPLALSLALTAFYTLPLLYEIDYVQAWMVSIERFEVQANLLSLGQVVARLTIFSLLLGIVSGATLIIWRKKIPTPTLAVLCAFAILLPFTIFLITPSSRPIWLDVEPMKWLQFPWRLLSPVTFLICFGSGALIYTPLPRSVLLYGGIVLGAIALISFSMVNRWPAASVPDDDLSPWNIRADRLPTTVLSEYLPIWVKENPGAVVSSRLEISHADARVRIIEESPLLFAYEVSSSEKTSITAHLFYFPGWRVYLNGSEIQPRITSRGLMQFELPKGSSMVELKFENTPVRTLGNGISIFGSLLFCILLLLESNSIRQQHIPKKRDGDK